MNEITGLKSSRAAQYIRMSTELQQYSIEHQRTAIAEYARAHNLTITQTYADEGRSGVHIQRRPALRKLIDDVQNGADFGSILVYDVSRWGRFQDIDESAHYEFLCKRAGVIVRYCNESFGNTISIANDIMKTIKRAMAGEFSRELSGKVHRGHLHLASLGYRQGSPPLYGFRRVVLDETGEPQGTLEFGKYKSIQSHRVILVPGPSHEREVVNEIYRLFVIGKLSPQAVADYLNERGISGKGRAKWTRASIVRVLTSEVYIGNYVYNKVGSLLKSPRMANDKSLWVRCNGAVAPIVNKRIFDAAQILMRRRSGSAGRSYAVKGSKGSTRFRGVSLVVKTKKEEPSVRPMSPSKTRTTQNGYRFYRETSNCLGWAAMITLGGVRHTTYFADSMYGSAEAARAAAERAGVKDDKIQREWVFIQRRLRVRSTSRSGIPGVTRYDAARDKNAHWLAYWIDSFSSKRVYKRFYIDEHGEYRARDLAVEARRLGTQQDRRRLSELTDLLRQRGWKVELPDI